MIIELTSGEIVELHKTNAADKKKADSNLT